MTVSLVTVYVLVRVPQKSRSNRVCVCVYIERFILRNWLATEEAVE